MTPKWAALTLALSAGACAVNPHSDVTSFAQRTSANSFEPYGGALNADEAMVLPVVHDRQTEGPSCGAHVLASVVNYWKRDATVTGSEIYAATPPASAAGYSMAELVRLGEARGLLARAVRLPEEAIIDQLERGRPVLTPVRVPSVYLQRRALPGASLPVVGLASDTVVDRSARFAELSRVGMVDHYLLVVGHDKDMFVVVEPLLGFRTISRASLERYRSPFGDAAIMFSGQPRE